LKRRKPTRAGLNYAARDLYLACRTLIREQTPCSAECPKGCAVGKAARAVAKALSR
jgi:hypothetical protein